MYLGRRLPGAGCHPWITSKLPSPAFSTHQSSCQRSWQKWQKRKKTNKQKKNPLAAYPLIERSSSLILCVTYWAILQILSTSNMQMDTKTTCVLQTLWKASKLRVAHTPKGKNKERQFHSLFWRREFWKNLSGFLKTVGKNSGSVLSSLFSFVTPTWRSSQIY